MYSPQDSTVYIVDDDVSVREGMAWLLRTRRLLSESFDSAEAFLAMLEKNTDPGAHPTMQAACILLDVRMPGMSGLALFEQLLAKGIAQNWPVIFLTGHADVPTAVAAMREGATDFIEKPYVNVAVLRQVQKSRDEETGELHKMQLEVRKHLALLDRKLEGRRLEVRTRQANLDALAALAASAAIALSAPAFPQNALPSFAPVIKRAAKSCTFLFPSRNFQNASVRSVVRSSWMSC